MGFFSSYGKDHFNFREVNQRKELEEMTSKPEFIYLSQEDVRATGIDMGQVIGVVENVLGLHDDGKVNLPSKVILDLNERERGRINAMPAYIGGTLRSAG